MVIQWQSSIEERLQLSRKIGLSGAWKKKQDNKVFFKTLSGIANQKILDIDDSIEVIDVCYQAFRQRVKRTELFSSNRSTLQQQLSTSTISCSKILFKPIEAFFVNWGKSMSWFTITASYSDIEMPHKFMKKTVDIKTSIH